MLGSARGVGLIVTLVRQKFLSIYLGPAGMGLLGLLRRFLDPLKEILPLGVNAGVVKFVSQSIGSGDEKTLRQTISTAAWFFLAVSSAAALAILLFARELAGRYLGDEAYRHLIVLAAVSLPLTLFAAYFNALLVGAGRIGTITRIHYIGHAVTLIVSLPLIILYELPGAVVGLVALEAFYCAAYGVAAARYVPIGLRSFRAERLGRLSGYGVATLADGGLWMLVFFLAFADYRDRFGTEALGFYEIISRLSLNYVAVLLFVINSYVFPRLAGFRDDRDAVKETNTAIRGIWLLMIPATVALSILIRPVIWVFSTREFYDGAAFLPWQMIGDVLFLTWITLGWALLARGRLGAYIAAALVRNLAFAAAYAAIQFWAGQRSLTFVPAIVPAALKGLSGWQAIVWAYATSGLVASGLAYLALKRQYGFGFEPRNWILVGCSCLVAMPVLFLPNWGPVWIGGKVAAVTVWALLVVKRSEWREGFGWIGGLLPRK